MKATVTTPYVRPATLDEALQARGEHPDWLVLAGGTDLMVPDARAVQVDGVLDVFAVDALHVIDVRADSIHLGACSTYAELLASARLRAALPLLAAAAREVAAEQIRERGTIGGNIVTCSPVGDMLPGLLALDARVVVSSPHQTRHVRYESFVRGYRTVDLGPDELLVAIDVPRPAPHTVQHWRKVGTRAAQSIAKLSIAATARVVHHRVTGLRLAFGGVADHPLRLHDVEALAEGAVADDALAAAVRDAVSRSLHPIDDVRSAADYRRDVAANLAARFVSSLRH